MPLISVIFGLAKCKYVKGVPIAPPNRSGTRPCRSWVPRCRSAAPPGRTGNWWYRKIRLGVSLWKTAAMPLISVLPDRPLQIGIDSRILLSIPPDAIILLLPDTPKVLYLIWCKLKQRLKKGSSFIFGLDKCKYLKDVIAIVPIVVLFKSPNACFI
jgi:hypothetical protein